VEEDIEEMRAEERAQQSESSISIMELICSPTLRAPLIIGIVMQLSQQLSGINAVSVLIYVFAKLLLLLQLFRTHTHTYKRHLFVINASSFPFLCVKAVATKVVVNKYNDNSPSNIMNVVVEENDLMLYLNCNFLLFTFCAIHTNQRTVVPSTIQVFYYSTSLFTSSGLTEESAKFATIGIGCIMVNI
jgi:hypothetical protein